tara:strand:- start:2456 stop:5635 length:3180 start_codon:yes stop_codon:yes gene_type:complete
MSFITLKSESQPSGKSVNNTEGANNFINHFNDPVIVNPGDTLELVSCSINKPDTFVIDEENSEFIFRRGYGLGDLADTDDLAVVGTRFAQHLVKIPVGTYSGEQLASTIQEQLERNTLLYSYTKTWTVSYTAAVPPAPASFQIIFGSAGLEPVVDGFLKPTREVALFNELAPINITDPLTGVNELENTNYTDPFIATDIESGRSPYDTKLNVKIGLESELFLSPTVGLQKARVKPVCICDGFTLEEPPVARPAGRVLTFDLANLGSIDDLSTPGSLTIISDGGPGMYTQGESVYLEFATPDFYRPQDHAGSSLYGVDYPTATAVVDTATSLLTGLTLLAPVVGYSPSDIFSVLKASAPATPALVMANFIERINGTGYVDGTAGIEAITQVPLGADPTAHGAQVVFTTDPLTGELLTATITDLESDVMSTTNAVFTVGDLFLRKWGDTNGIIRVASVTAAPPAGDKFYFKNWENTDGFDVVALPIPFVPPAEAGWTHEVVVAGETWYLAVHEDAALVMSRDYNNSIYNGAGNDWYKAIADPAELAAGKPFNTSCSWQRVRYGDDPAPNRYTTIFLTSDDGVTRESVPLDFIKTYPQVQFGYCKKQMVNNGAETTNPQEKYRAYNYDLNLTFAGDIIAGVGVLKMNGIQQWGADNDVSFPENDWDDLLTHYEDVVVPFTNPGAFIFGVSELEINLQIVNHFNPIMEVNFLNAGVADVPAIVFLDEPDIPTFIPASYRSNLRELYYPLSAVVFYGEAYPFNIDALNADNPGGVYGQSRLSYLSEGYSRGFSNWREENRGNMLWEIAYPQDEREYWNWNDDNLQALQAGFNVGNMPIVMKFDKLNIGDIQAPDGVTPLPPTQASGKISYFDASPGNPKRPYTDWFPFISNGIGPLLGMPSFWQEPTPAPVTGFNSSVAPVVGPRQTIQVEIPEFNVKSWSGGSNDVGRAIGVIPAEQWSKNETLTNDTLYYKSDYPKPINLNSQVSQPMYSLSCRLRDTEGKLIQDLQNPTTLTFIIKEGDESKQQRIMNKAMEHMNNTKSNNQDNRISTANENMPRINNLGK